MRICDYSRSFVTFAVPGNNARIQVEARCQLSQPDGSAEQYLMFASCKSEDTYAARNLFKQPNYDFSGIFSNQRYCVARIHSASEMEHLEAGLIADRFEGVSRQIKETDRVRPLTDKAAVVEATLAGQVIVARNEIKDATGGVTALIEYPVKTMNVNAERVMFQVDTGPLPLYDFRSQAPEVMARFRWAYVAYNDFTAADFVIQTPTPICRGDEIVARTTHYSALEVYPQAVNSLFALEE